ncbi:MAG: AsmA-like C-terminal region-containing protein [Alphaproteobacteria bacterium]
MIRPATKFLVHALAAFAGIVAIVFVIGAWRLSTGPISLAFVTPYLQEALTRSESPYRLEVDDTILTWVARERALDIRVLGLRALGPEGMMVASAPEVSLGLSVPALFRGFVAPTRFDVIAPRLRLVRDEEGRVALGLGAKAEASSDLLVLLIADLLAPPGSARPMDYLERISVVGADLDVKDRLLGLSWRARQADIELAREGEGLRGEAALDVAFEEQTVHVDVTGLYQGPARDVVVDLAFTEIEPARLAAFSPSFAPLTRLRLPVSGTLEVVFAADGALSSVAFALDGGAGRVLVPSPFEVEVPVAKAQAQGRFTSGPGELALDELTLDLGGPTFTLQGRAGNLESEPVLSGEAHLDDLPLARLSEFWPPGLGGGRTRDWVLTNLSGGVVRTGEARFDLDLADLRAGRLRPGSVEVTFVAENVTVRYYGPLPKARGVDGRAVITGDRLEAVMSKGTVAGLVLSDGSFTLTGLGRQPRATVALTARGSVRDAMNIVTHPFLGYAQKLGIDPAQTGGRHETRLEFSFPVPGKLKPGEFRMTARSHLMDASLQGAFGLYDISRGEFDLRLDNAGMDVIGTVAVNGVAGRITWHENFAAESPLRRRFTFRTRVNDSQRTALEMPGEELLTGPVVLDVEATSENDGGQAWMFELDVGDAYFRLPPLLWAKQPGVEGLVRLEARRTPGQAVEITSLEVDAGDLLLTGTGELDPALWTVRRLDIARLTFGLTDVSASLVETAGDYEVDLEGGSLDLRPYLETARSGESTPLPPLRLTARLDRLITRADQILNDVTVGGRYRDDRWEVLFLEGRFAAGKKVVFRIAPAGDRRALRLTAEDAGYTLRAFDMFDNGSGGRLEITGTIDDGLPGRPVRGRLVIENFRVEKTPVLARLLSLGSFTGVLNLLKGEGVPFTRVEAPFTKRDRIIEIEEARAFGPALGITFEGRLDLAADVADLRGTLVPAYTINSLFGNIPVIGDLLVGTEGGGVFAATYHATGSLADPTVTVNPLAALAPGVLRELFGFIGGAPAEEGEVGSAPREKPGE